MELKGTICRLAKGMEYLAVILFGLAIAANSSKPPITFTMPGERCNTEIITNGNQYKVMTVRNAVSEEITTSDGGGEHPEPSGDEYQRVDEHHDNGHDMKQGPYPANVTCMLSFRTDTNKRFYMRVIHFNMEFSKNCANDGLFLYSAATDDDNALITLRGLCGETLSLPNYFYSVSNEVTLKFVSNDRNNNFDGFVMLLTPFWKEPGQNCSAETEFKCELSKKCITKEALCNQENQCEDGSDEPPNCKRNHAPTPISGSSSVFIIVALFVTLLTRPVFIGGLMQV